MATKKPKPLERARIITIYNQKGGCGKTQTTMQLGGSLALRGYRVLIVDMDPQGTASTWSAQAEVVGSEFPATVISLSTQREKMVGELRKLSTMYDFILIDCPPAIDSPIPWAALCVSDVGLVPVIPLLANIWATREAVNVGLKAKEENEELELRFLPTNVSRGNLYKEGIEQLKTIDAFKTLNVQVSHRNAYPMSEAYGCTVHGLESKSAAIDEINLLTTEILKLFGIKG